MFDTKPYESKMNQALDHFGDELKKVRTGRAHPGMLDGLVVEVYGSKMPLNQVANITAPEAQLLQITPFDPSTISAVAKAIREDQSLGLNPSDDGRVVRVPVPPLTEERRHQLVKQIADKVEDARIALRNIRQDAQKDMKRRKEAKEMSEDDVRAGDKSIDALMHTFQTKIDEAFRTKEKDVLTV
ncbi:MAG: ribosome recycling factor [Candidatus Saccharimonadaceae bacterium]